ncbi:TPR domain-containing protein [Planoprotostelium fungivorum]|uniref:TPR domain-containing protein n=1 Tax=Planoprotostelium fungivorum TaxID=1890364 RepID=A0A2P6MRE1_9EUKA|nr:TPR domain-containing protein [Planoprotostelium fungivorum]
MDVEARLQIQVSKARGLLLNDLNWAYNCYATVQLQEQKFRTRTSRDRNPIWDQTFTCQVSEPITKIIVCVQGQRDITNLGGEVYRSHSQPTKRLTERKVFLGRTIIPISELSDGKLTSGWYPLKQRRESDGDITGDVYLELQYRSKPVWTPIYNTLRAIEEGQYDKAIEMINKAIGVYPNMHMLYAVRSGLFLSADMTTEAMQDAIKVTELAQDAPEGYYRAGMVHFHNDDIDSAIKCFNIGETHDLRIITERVGLEFSPDDEKCAQALRQVKRDEASIRVRRAILHGREKYKEKDFEFAKNYFNEAIELNPNNFFCYLLRLYCNIQCKNLDAAIKDANQIISLAPDWPKVTRVFEWHRFKLYQNDYTKAGYLMKAGQINMMYKKRWIVYKEPVLLYYENRTDLKPKGMTILASFELQKSGKRNFRIVTPGRNMELKTETETERNDWVEVLEKPLNKQTNYKLPEADEREHEIVEEKRTETVIDLELLHVETSQTALDEFSKEMLKSVQAPLYLRSVSLQDSVKSGMVFKMGSDLGFGLLAITAPSWSKQFAILKNNNLFMVDPPKNMPETHVEMTPTAYLSLNSQSKVVFAADKAKKEFAIEVSGVSNDFLLSFNNRDEMNEWAVAILESSGNHSDAVKWMEGQNKATKFISNKIDRKSVIVPTAAPPAPTAVSPPINTQKEVDAMDTTEKRRSRAVVISSSFKEVVLEDPALRPSTNAKDINERGFRFGLSPSNYNSEDDSRPTFTGFVDPEQPRTPSFIKANRTQQIAAATGSRASERQPLIGTHVVPDPPPSKSCSFSEGDPLSYPSRNIPYANVWQKIVTGTIWTKLQKKCMHLQIQPHSCSMGPKSQQYQDTYNDLAKILSTTERQLISQPECQ